MTIPFLIPNALTAGNLLAGLAAAARAWNGEPEAACRLVLLCALLDGLDGWMARRLNGASEWGGRFDSLADAVSFGLAPALLFCRSGVPGAAFIAAAYFCCAAGRLVRFQRMAPEGKIGDFVGLPVTAGGALYAACRLWGPAAAIPSLLPALGVLALSGLMVSRVRFPRIRYSVEAKLAIPSR